jgi:phosphopantothenoylcysteine decarboxylase/phosphopantothenate--cysteine ligase
MGVALAAAAWRRGADVTLIAGPLSVEPPVGVSIIDVETAAEMRDAVAAHLRDADVLIMAAAPADFRPATVAEQKIKKSSAPSSIALEPTDDILVSTQEFRNPAAIVVGFALETEAAVAGGREKLRRKSLDLVVVNDATEPGAGFGVDTNRVTLVFGNGTPDEALPLLAKSDVADAILDRIEGLLRAR